MFFFMLDKMISFTLRLKHNRSFFHKRNELLSCCPQMKVAIGFFEFTIAKDVSMIRFLIVFVLALSRVECKLIRAFQKIPMFCNFY